MPIDACFVEVVIDNSKFILAGVSVALAVAAFTFLKMRRLSSKAKIGLIYAHLFGLFFPISLFTTNAACGFLCLPCFESPLGLAVLAVPSALLFSTVAGFVVIPLYFLYSGRSVEVKGTAITSFISRHSKTLGIRPPRVYAVKNPRPFAFSFRSFRSAIVISIGMMDILRRKELEAVILHELAHVKSRASVLKLSASLMRFSPFWILKSFHRELDIEEAAADKYVQIVQGTYKYLKGAKIKVNEYYGNER
ncbi:MAG: M48 family metalloprotease [Candidatus Aenigmarchaeota archaeon]|nr:M48 family metalloprotease [Candidatus Aenigmarchaeota archaeon]